MALLVRPLLFVSPPVTPDALRRGAFTPAGSTASEGACGRLPQGLVIEIAFYYCGDVVARRAADLPFFARLACEGGHRSTAQTRAFRRTLFRHISSIIPRRDDPN